MAEYKIQGETLTAIADAIRAKKDTTAIFTPGQMAMEIEEIVTCDDLPSAEEASFGNVIDDGSNSRAFSTSSSFETDGNTLSANTFTWGFDVAEAFEIRAFQYYDSGYYLQNKTISMSDATGKVVFKYTWETVKAGWNEVVLNTPIVLLAGESYKVSSTSKRHSYLQKSKVIFDSRLTNITGTSYTTSGVIPTTYTIIAPVNFTIGTISELRPDSYQIERNTMDDLADAIREKAGVEATISPAQMIAIVDAVNLNLQEKTVTPTTEVQEVTPDAGYFGLSKVIVQAIPKVIKIVPWSTGTDEQIAAMVAALDAGEISIADTGWKIGDERKVTLSAMAATGVGESHAQESVTFVLMDSQHYNLTEPTAGGDTKDHFVVGLKNYLATTGYMNPTQTSAGSWEQCARRTWCNNVFRAAIPETLRECFKQFKVPTATEYNSSGVTESSDYFALFAEKEVYGTSAYSTANEAAVLSQIEWYTKSATNRNKKNGDNGTEAYPSYFLRSPYKAESGVFCRSHHSDKCTYTQANSCYGISPFGCI